MNRAPKTDRKESNLISAYLFLILFLAIPFSMLKAQPHYGLTDTSQTRTMHSKLSTYLTSDRLFWYTTLKNFDFHAVELNYPSLHYQDYLNQNLLHYSFEPFKIDFRESSYYVPQVVRDELNMIMNRPRDSAFMPVLGVAWIAYQLASHTLELQQKSSIDYNKLLSAGPAIPVLYSLWEIKPQTAQQIYRDKRIHPVMTFRQLQEKLEILQQNNLIKSRIIPPDSLFYFPAITRDQILSILDSAEKNLSIVPSEKAAVDSIRNLLR
jgi:hypothetical protein